MNRRHPGYGTVCWLFSAWIGCGSFGGGLGFRQGTTTPSIGRGRLTFIDLEQSKRHR
jgi:hypothetical protein